MSQFTLAERQLVKNIVAMYSIKKVSDSEIIEEIYRQTNKRIVQKTLYFIRRRIKQDSFEWYERMRQDQFEYIHEFKERINEILDLQKRHYEIADSPVIPISIKQVSLVELHKLSVTLSNLFDVAPYIVGVGQRKDNNNGTPLSDTSENTTARSETEQPISYVV